MINIQLFFIFLSCFALIYLAIGLWASRSVTTLQNYFLANRNIGLLQLTFALIASQLGSGMILGTAYRAYHIGLWGILYTGGMCIGFLILSLGLAHRMRQLNIATTAEIFQTNYHSLRLKMFASALSIISLWGILIAQIVASKMLLSSIGITDPYIFIFCWALVICYTMLGGLHSIIMVDMAQVSFIIAIFMIALWYCLPDVTTILTMFNTHQTLFDNSLSFTQLAPALFIPTLFSLIEQDLGQKFFAAKSPRIATIAAFIAGLFLILFSCIPLLFGMMAKTSGITITHNTNPLIVFLLNTCPSTLFLLVVCGIIAAITSTSNSLMCAISSNVVQDFSTVISIKHNKLLTTKLISAAIGCSALYASFFMHGDIISILEESYRLLVLCLFIPTLFAYFGTKCCPQPAWAACLAGLFGYCARFFYPQPTLISDLFALTLSAVGFFVVLHITNKKNINPFSGNIDSK